LIGNDRVFLPTADFKVFDNPSLMLDDLVAAKALLRDKKITVKEVAKRLKVDPSTLYRHLPGGRSSIN
jgi:DNA-binding MarR family transcriptional regulator